MTDLRKEVAVSNARIGGPLKSKPQPAAPAVTADPRPATGLLTSKQVAALLGISVMRLGVWRTKGKGPAVMRISERTLRYHPDDVEVYCSSLRPAG